MLKICKSNLNENHNIQMKNTWNKIKSILHIAEETISDYKERAIETIQNKK